MNSQQDVNISGKKAFIYKPKDKLLRKIRNLCSSEWNDIYKQSLNSLFVPDVAVFGRWAKDYHLGKELGYRFDPIHFRFSQAPEELQRVYDLIKSGNCEVIREFIMPHELVEKAVKEFKTYQNCITAYENAIENLLSGNKKLKDEARYISNCCFGREDLNIK